MRHIKGLQNGVAQVIQDGLPAAKAHGKVWLELLNELRQKLLRAIIEGTCHELNPLGRILLRDPIQQFREVLAMRALRINEGQSHYFPFVLRKLQWGAVQLLDGKGRRWLAKIHGHRCGSQSNANGRDEEQTHSNTILYYGLAQ